MDRSEGRETRCNAIFSFVFTGSIFYYEDEFLQGDGSQGKYHHRVLFSWMEMGGGRRSLRLQTVFTKFIF